MRKHRDVSLLSEYQPLHLVLYAVEDEDKIKAKLIAEGFDLSKDNFVLIPFGPHDNRYDKAFFDYCNSHSEFLEQLKKVKLMFNMSTSTLDINPPRDDDELARYLRQSLGETVPCISIAEHGAVTFDNERKPSHEYNYPNVPEGIADVERLEEGDFGETRLFSLGLRPNEWGFILQRKTKPSDPAAVLASIQDEDGKNREESNLDKLFLRSLLRTGEDELSVEQRNKSAQELLSNTLLIPAYLQEGPHNFVTIMNAVAKSELSNPYKEITFVVNSKQTFRDPSEYLSFMSPEIQSITITRKMGDRIVEDVIENTNRSSRNPGKNIRIMEGFWLSESSHNKLYQCAQVFGGCSGDNSLQETLDYGLIPLMQVRTHKKMMTIDFISYAKALLGDESAPEKVNLVASNLQGLLDLRSLERDPDTNRDPSPNKVQELSQKIADCLTREGANQWKTVIGDLHENRNFNDVYEKIVAHGLKLASTSTMRATPGSR